MKVLAQANWRQCSAMNFVRLGLLFAAFQPLRAQQPPTITVQPGSQSVMVTSNAVFTVVASGHNPLSYQWRFSTTRIMGATNSTLVLTNVQCTNAGSYSVVITNKFGSTTSAAAVLTPINPNPPVILCPSNLIVQCYSDVPPPATQDVIASDNSGQVSTEHISDAATTNGAQINIARTFRATGACGNFADCTQTIIVRDTIPPTISCPPDKTNVACDGVFPGLPMAVDNCDTNPTIQNVFVFQRTGTNGLAEIYTTCWRAYDHSGNTNYCCQQITIVPYQGYVPPGTNTSAKLLASRTSFSPKSLTPSFSLQRGVPGIMSGTGSSFPGPQLASPCGRLSGTNLWFGLSSRDDGYAVVRADGCRELVIYAGINICFPTSLVHVACCLATNNPCQLRFFAQKTNLFWIALDGVTNRAALELAFGFDPGFESFGLNPDRSFELRSGIAPAVSYHLLATTNIAQAWTTLLTTNLSTNFPYLYYRDATATNFPLRFYRIAPSF
jgi:hypothetical protein